MLRKTENQILSFRMPKQAFDYSVLNKQHFKENCTHFVQKLLL